MSSSHTTSNLMTMDNTADLFNVIASQSAQASTLLWSVPIISGFILSGSWFSIMGMGSAIAAHSTAGSNNNDIQKQQADLSNEKRLRELSGDAWSPTAGEMGRMNIDQSLAQSSGDTLGQIKAMGDFGKISKLASDKSALSAIEERAIADNMDYSDARSKGETSVMGTKVSNESMSKLVSHMDGSQQLIDTMSSSDSYSKVFGAGKNAAMESEFNKLHAANGGNLTKAEFYEQITAGDANKAVGTLKGLNDSKVSMQDHANIVETGVHQDVGSEKAAREVAQHLNKTVEDVAKDSSLSSVSISTKHGKETFTLNDGNIVASSKDSSHNTNSQDTNKTGFVNDDKQNNTSEKINTTTEDSRNIKREGYEKTESMIDTKKYDNSVTVEGSSNLKDEGFEMLRKSQEKDATDAEKLNGDTLRTAINVAADVQMAIKKEAIAVPLAAAASTIEDKLGEENVAAINSAGKYLGDMWDRTKDNTSDWIESASEWYKKD